MAPPRGFRRNSTRVLPRPPGARPPAVPAVSPLPVGSPPRNPHRPAGSPPKAGATPLTVSLGARSAGWAGDTPARRLDAKSPQVTGLLGTEVG